MYTVVFNMPIKAYKKRLARKERYTDNSETDKIRACEYYVQHKDTIISHMTERQSSKKAWRKRHSALMTKRIQNNSAYQERNRQKAKENVKKRLSTENAYRIENKDRAKNYIRRRRAIDKDFSQKEKSRLREKKRRLNEDENYRDRRRQKTNDRIKQKLAVDKDYRESNKIRAKTNTARRLQSNSRYKADNNERARIRIRKISKDAGFKSYQRRSKQIARHSNQSSEKNDDMTRAKNTQRLLTQQQRYWIRRSRIITATRRQHRMGNLKRKMMAQSNRPMFDVNMLFAKVQKTMSRSLARLKGLHSHIATKTTAYMEHFPTDRQPDEETLTSALDGRRFHTSASEVYYWEHGYKVAKLKDSIPVDRSGKAHVFKAIAAQRAAAAPPDDTQVTATDAGERDDTTVKQWECHPELCIVDQQSITDTLSLFSTISRTRPSNCMNFYLTLDKCHNPARSQRLGHTLFCPLSDQCKWADQQYSPTTE